MELSAIHIYPIKGARGVALASADVVERGLRDDRRFMIVSDAGLFLTQREHPELARVGTAIEGDALVIEAGDHRLRVPLSPMGPRRAVTVWSSEVDAVEVPEAHRFFSAILGTPAHLVYMPDDARRPVKNRDAIVSFADGYPMLLTSESSLGDLNAHMDAPLPMDRFRPNLVVRGAPAWAEDTWDRIRVAGIELELAKPCDRCVVTTTDQQTGERGVEPLRTLARIRARDHKVWFGENLVHHGTGTVRVGDVVTVVSLVAEPLDR